jgi:hypothetical protein
LTAKGCAKQQKFSQNFGHRAAASPSHEAHLLLMAECPELGEGLVCEITVQA